ncbi:MAG: asparagine synthase C-terminal domain-containing protein, partial [Gammaproteobacteria bacterium]|nr:asparagine synthase C-terminal domain-containing protein [Gammaproteobacteria bacterium]
SGGLDSRAVLASIPEAGLPNVTTFTYGIRGSTEITEARHIADAMGLDHREIFLQDEFLERLPKLLVDTVYLSDGLQVINRSNLPLVYAAVAAGERPAAAILTGVSGDHVFRDHISAWGNVPYLISADVAAMHREGRRRIDQSVYEQMFAGQFSEIESGLEHMLDRLELEYGKFNQPESYYRYLMYVAGSRYFGGQAAIANRYSYFRTPYWDRRMVKFGIESCLGTAGLSVRTEGKDKFVETVLQASVVASNARLAKVPYVDLPVSVFTRKNKASYQAARVVRRLKATLSGRRRIAEEDWPLWYRTILAEQIDDLLGETSRVREYVRAEFIAMKRAENDIHMLGKLITAEIALRLAENGWRRS